MGNNSGGHAAAAWVFNVVHNQVLLIYSRITPHLAMAYVRHFSASNNAIAAMNNDAFACVNICQTQRDKPISIKLHACGGVGSDVFVNK